MRQNLRPCIYASQSRLTMLEANGIGCLRGERRLFADIGFSVSEGQLLRVAGANGSGKTSLLRILCGLLSPSEGEVLWNARPIASLREDYHRVLAYIGHLNGLKDEMTPHENLAVASTLAGAPAGREDRLKALDGFGVAHCADLPVRYLSQGQRRRASLARLALHGPARIWILDEPFNALDAGAVMCMERLITGHVAAGGIVVFATHLEVAITAVSLVLVNLDHQADRA